MGDFYTDNPAELRGKPKSTIADYVEQNGILVPRRFATLDDALSSGVPIIARSEHPQDYDGVSGLLDSINIKHGHTTTEEKLRKVALASGACQEYCKILGINESDFISEVSFSFWEKLKGTNLTIVADSSVSDKYYIFVKVGYLIDSFAFMSRENVNFSSEGFPKNILKDRMKVIDFYERVRTLSRFDPKHCPIIEVQYLDGKIFFLQYHRARDYEPATFKTGQKSNEQFPAYFVRGITTPEGLSLKVNVAYEAWFSKSENWRVTQEDGSTDSHGNAVYSELMARRRKLQLFFSNHPQDLALQLSGAHLVVSQLFKPALSLSVEKGGIIPTKEHIALRKLAASSRQDQFIDLHVISDGQTAYVKRI